MSKHEKTCFQYFFTISGLFISSTLLFSERRGRYHFAFRMLWTYKYRFLKLINLLTLNVIEHCISTNIYFMDQHNIKIKENSCLTVFDGTTVFILNKHKKNKTKQTKNEKTRTALKWNLLLHQIDIQRAMFCLINCFYFCLLFCFRIDLAMSGLFY